MNRRLTIALAAGSAVALVLGLPAPASADAQDSTTEQHCVIDLTAAPVRTTCYDTFTAAVADATGGRILDAAATTEEARSDFDLDERLRALAADIGRGAADQLSSDETAVPGSTEPGVPGDPGVAGDPGADDGEGRPVDRSPYVLSIEYTDRDFGGSSAIFKGTDSCKLYSYDLDYVGDGWNDVISSFRTFSECAVKHFEDRDFGGASLPWETTKEYIGAAMNDQASSLKWQLAR